MRCTGIQPSGQFKLEVGVPETPNSLTVGPAAALVPDCRPFSTLIGRAQTFARVGLNPDGFDLANPFTSREQLESPRLQILGGSVRKNRFQRHEIRKPLLVKTRRVNRGLRIHAQPHPVQDGKQRS